MAHPADTNRSRTFDWTPRFDERSRGFAVGPVVGAQPDVEKLWRAGVLIDQGSEGACVGFGWTGEASASPAPDRGFTGREGNKYALSYYNRCKEIDEWAGVDYSGTSVLAGAKVGKERGHHREYRWCFGIDDVRKAVIAEGPVVLGIPWHQGMYQTTDHGLVTVKGRRVGGHCILVTGYNPNLRMVVDGKAERIRAFRLRNSWGDGWGRLDPSTNRRNGNGWIRYDDLSRLLDGGEACVPVRRRQTRIADWREKS